VARDRKRAKQRQQRRTRGASVPARSEPVRADLPGALGHASGDVDEFDAALVHGAQGVPMPDAPPEPPGPELGDGEPGANGAGSGLPGIGDGGDRGGRGGGGDGVALEPAGDDAEAALPSTAREASQPLPTRAIAFLRASWAELQRVQWPNRTQVSQATAVVLGFVAIAGVYLGAADWVAQKIVNFIL
jgi:preprotein translocase subunit SecE